MSTPVKRAMGSHQSARMGTDIWLTPRHILNALGEFDLLDPCSAPNPDVWPTATAHYTLPTDGLVEPWFGRVWCNPPYGAAAWNWLGKLAEHGTGTALIFARTETAGFVQQVWGKADGILFLHGRLYFHHADGSQAKANSGAPSCLVAYGESDSSRLANSGLPGSFVSNWRQR
ncbi:DNA N-6-adenine-methyltransferase [Mycolicibacterium fortuitum]